MERVLTGVPDSEIDELVADLESEGAVVEKAREHGAWTVLATFPLRSRAVAETELSREAEARESAAPGSALPWLEIGRGEVGVKELAGPESNPRIEEYFSTTSLGARPDDVPWCAAFVSFCVESAGIEGRRSARARDWLQWGRAIEDPVEGCVVVLRRGPDRAKGHIGFYVRDAGTHVELLGGNQSNEVKVAAYPKADILGYRLPG